MGPSDVQKLLQHSQQANSLENAYSIWMNFMFVFSTFLTFISLYLFLARKSKLHPELRSIFIHTTLTSYAMTSTMTLWKAIVLPPCICGYPLGSIFKKIGPYSFLIGMWICWSSVIHLGVAYFVAFNLHCYRMKIAARKTNQNRLFEWFLRDQNTALFLRISAVLNFGFAAIPVASLAWFTIPVEEVPLLEEIRAKHPEMILMVIRENCVFLISVLVCCIIISLEIFYCLKTNWSILKIVQKTGKIVTQKTHSLQLFMYRLFSLQLLMIILFLYTPTLLASFHMVEIIDLQNFATINIVVMSLYCPAQSILSLLGYPEVRNKFRLFKSPKKTENSLTQRLIRAVVFNENEDKIRVCTNPTFSLDFGSSSSSGIKVSNN